MNNKSWLEVEMEESTTLFRKKLEEMNDIDMEELCSEDIQDLKNIYKTLYYISVIQKSDTSK